MQLFSLEKKVSQHLTGHAAAFATLKIPGRDDPAHCLVFHGKTAGSQEPPKLFVREIGRDPSHATLLREAKAGQRPATATRVRMFKRPETKAYIAQQFADLIKFIPYSYDQTAAPSYTVHSDRKKLRLRFLEEHKCGPNYWQQLV